MWEWCEPPKTESDVHEKSRSYRKRLRHAGIKVAAKGRPLPGTFASGWKHRMDGGWERRPKIAGAIAPEKLHVVMLLAVKNHTKCGDGSLGYERAPFGALQIVVFRTIDRRLCCL